MAKTNLKTHHDGYVAGTPTTTFEGGPAIKPEDKELLRRLVFSCFLWENNFYVDGKTVAEQISEVATRIAKNDAAFVRTLAVDARKVHNLRHVPLWVIVALAKAGKLTSGTVSSVVSRPDEMAELLAQYSLANGRTGTKKLNKLSKAMQKGLADSFVKFDEYQLSKWDHAGDISLKDVLFLTHAKPIDDNMAAMWSRLIKGELKTADTWETNLSGGKDKKETFTRLLQEHKLGYQALLMNLKNMRESGVDEKLVFEALRSGAGRSRMLPFQFIAAARHNPQWESVIEEAMLASLAGMPKIPGKTILLVDVSTSMSVRISDKSELTRLDAAKAIAMLTREVCENVTVYRFSNDCEPVADRRGFALGDAIGPVIGGTSTGAALEYVKKASGGNADRILVFTDEQARDAVGTAPAKKGYIMNVASYENGVGYKGNWTHVNGFSESVVKYIQAIEGGE